MAMPQMVTMPMYSGLVALAARGCCVRQVDGDAHPLAVGIVGSSNGVEALVFDRQWSLNYVIFILLFIWPFFDYSAPSHI
jgi:hypothetical protein